MVTTAPRAASDHPPSWWRAPIAYLRSLDTRQPTLATAPWRAWGVLTGIAFAGSAIYGASLSRVLPNWRPRAASLWLTGSAGFSWCVFGPALVRITRGIRLRSRTPAW